MGTFTSQTQPDYTASGGTLLNNNPANGIVMNPIRSAPVPGVERNPIDRPISMREVCEDDRGQMIREWLTAWDTRDQAKKQLLGYPYVSPLKGTRYIQRYLPDYVPWLLTDENGFEPPKPYLWCTSLPSVEPDGTTPPDGITQGTWNECRYGNAFITALYTTPTYELLSDADMVKNGYVDGSGNPDESTLQRYVTRMGNPQQKYQTIPIGSFVFATSNPTLSTLYPGSPGRVELEGDFSLIWHRVPKYAIPWKYLNPYVASTVGGNPYIPAIDQCLGAVNVSAFAGCKKGTLLLTAAIFKPIRSPIGMRLWDIEYRFKYFAAQSANSLTNGGTSGYQYGHNLVLYYGDGKGNIPSPTGYYEILAGLPGVVNLSNYLVADGTTAAQDYQNLYNYRDFAPLFRVPQLKNDPGNA